MGPQVVWAEVKCWENEEHGGYWSGLKEHQVMELVPKCCKKLGIGGTIGTIENTLDYKKMTNQNRPFLQGSFSKDQCVSLTLTSRTPTCKQWCLQTLNFWGFSMGMWTSILMQPLIHAHLIPSISVLLSWYSTQAGDPMSQLSTHSWCTCAQSSTGRCSTNLRCWHKINGSLHLHKWLPKSRNEHIGSSFWGSQQKNM